MPRVSVVMAAYNAEEFLQPAIDSILCQSFRDFELIIVDDGSTDATHRLLQSCPDGRVRVLSQENCGLAASLNRGIAAASGEYIARMDADDTCRPSRLASQVKFMDEHSECVAVGTFATLMTSQGEVIGVARRPQDHATIVRALATGVSPLFHGSVLMRKASVTAVGGYPNVHPAQDWHLWHKLGNVGELRNLPEPLYGYRKRSGAISSRPRQESRALRHKLAGLADGRAEAVAAYAQAVPRSACGRHRERILAAEADLALGRLWLQVGERSRALPRLLAAVRGAPSDSRMWFSLGLGFMPIGALRSWWRRRDPYLWEVVPEGSLREPSGLPPGECV